MKDKDMIKFINKLLKLAKNEITSSWESCNYAQDNIMPEDILLGLENNEH